MYDLLGYPALFDQLTAAGLDRFVERVQPACRCALTAEANADFTRWSQAIAALDVQPGLTTHFDQAAVAASSPHPMEVAANERLLRELMPWRKGPFELDGIVLDTEWRSDWKWDRIERAVDWPGATVLDVGSGNGYFGWRMLAAGAASVLGLDPFLLYIMQHAAVRRFVGAAPNHVLPLSDAVLTEPLRYFDVVLSMGVLYHRTSPIDHLTALGRAIRPGGKLILETLILDDSTETVLVPADRYAKMRNVWFLPSLPMLVRWLQRCGYKEIEHVDTTPTTTAEQRKTAWMDYESLSDFLSTDQRQTIEGYPPPLRAILTATKG
jgi:tRNA (mo5U34)-methyltransferase